jgi:hypothetical protein
MGEDPLPHEADDVAALARHHFDPSVSEMILPPPRVPSWRSIVVLAVDEERLRRDLLWIEVELFGRRRYAAQDEPVNPRRERGCKMRCAKAGGPPSNDGEGSFLRRGFHESNVSAGGLARVWIERDPVRVVVHEDDRSHARNVGADASPVPAIGDTDFRAATGR